MSAVRSSAEISVRLLKLRLTTQELFASSAPFCEVYLCALEEANEHQEEDRKDSRLCQCALTAAYKFEICSRKTFKASSHPEENAESSGDSALQEELIKQLTRSMGKQRLIEAAKKSIEKAEKERLKSELQDVRFLFPL